MNRLKQHFVGCCLFVGLTCFVFSAFAYKLQYAKSGDLVRWHESCFKYSINENGAPGIDETTLHDTIRASFDAWENADCSYFYFVETDDASCDDIGYVEKTGNINLFVFRESNWAIDADHDPSAIALTTTSWNDNNGQLLDADMEFNSEYFDFGTEGVPGFADLQNTATHEIGHTIGLDHSSVNGSTMEPSAGLGDTDKRTLAADDIEGLCELYPLEDDPDICLDPHCGLDLSCSSTECNSSGVASPKTEVPPGCSITGVGALPEGGAFRTLVDWLFSNH
jgi:hypothetical protein